MLSPSTRKHYSSSTAPPFTLKSEPHISCLEGSLRSLGTWTFTARCNHPQRQVLRDTREACQHPTRCLEVSVDLRSTVDVSKCGVTPTDTRDSSGGHDRVAHRSSALPRVGGLLSVVSGYIHESRHFHWHDICVDGVDFYVCGYDLKFIKLYITSWEGRKDGNIICDAMLCTSAWPSAQSGPFQEVFRKQRKGDEREAFGSLSSSPPVEKHVRIGLATEAREGPYNQDEAEHFVALSDHLFEGMKRLRTRRYRLVLCCRTKRKTKTKNRDVRRRRR